jgi:hypothetical protein
MNFRVTLSSICLLLFVHAPAMAGQTIIAKGAGGAQAVDFSSWGDLSTYAPDLRGSDDMATLVALDNGVRIQPAFAPAQAESYLKYNLQRINVPWKSDYDVGTFTTQVSSIPWDVGITVGAISMIGLSDWNWGSQSFHFTDEGWFGTNTRYLGVDKFGHAYSTFLLSEYFTQRIAHSTSDPAGAALTGSIIGMGIQTGVEVVDGFSNNGFSPQDFVADGIGAAFSMLRSTFPDLASKVDFRMEYIPSGNVPFNPWHDYTGQKYVMALKLGGFEEFENTPLRFVELQAGYYARGFTQAEKDQGEPLRREPYVAIGLNLQELLDGAKVHDTIPALAASTALQYVQVPYTYVATSQN